MFTSTRISRAVWWLFEFWIFSLFGSVQTDFEKLAPSTISFLFAICARYGMENELWVGSNKCRSIVNGGWRWKRWTLLCWGGYYNVVSMFLSLVMAFLCLFACMLGTVPSVLFALHSWMKFLVTMLRSSWCLIVMVVPAPERLMLSVVWLFG